MLEEGFAQVFTDVLRYQAMGIPQVVLCVIMNRGRESVNTTASLYTLHYTIITFLLISQKTGFTI